MRLSIAVVAFALLACATVPPATAYKALALACERTQVEIVETAERECIDSECAAKARAALEASNLTCEAGLSEIQAEIDAQADDDGGT